MAKLIRLNALRDGWEDLESDVSPASPVGQLATMLVSLLDDGVSRDNAIARAVRWFIDAHGETAPSTIFAELERVPLRYVHALEVALEILDVKPRLMPELARATFIENLDELERGAARVKRPALVRLPPALQARACVALDGGRPGFAFFASGGSGEYSLQVGTPGTWRFAVLATGILELVGVKRHTNAGLVEEFTVRVVDVDTDKFL